MLRCIVPIREGSVPHGHARKTRMRRVNINLHATSFCVTLSFKGSQPRHCSPWSPSPLSSCAGSRVLVTQFTDGNRRDEGFQRDRVDPQPMEGGVFKKTPPSTYMHTHIHINLPSSMYFVSLISKRLRYTHTHTHNVL